MFFHVKGPQADAKHLTLDPNDQFDVDMCSLDAITRDSTGTQMFPTGEATLMARDFGLPLGD